MEVETLAAEIVGTPGIEGITLSGGEPFAQAGELLELVKITNEAGLSTFLFTGYEIEELSTSAQKQLLGMADIVVSGRYIEAKRASSLTWRGSSNQKVHFLTSRYSAADMLQAAELEIIIDLVGRVTATGIPTNWVE